MTLVNKFIEENNLLIHEDARPKLLLREDRGKLINSKSLVSDDKKTLNY